MAIKPLDIPILESVKFSKNFVKSAVCELKFPILLELEEKPPIEFHKRLKKEYPLYEKIDSVNFSATKTENKKSYQMWSVDKKWVIEIQPDTIIVKPTNYMRFEELFERVTRISELIKPIIDSDFFTRVGLRYINMIPFENGDFAGHINPVLVAPFEDMTFGSLDQYSQLVRGKLENGGYCFRHGLKPIDSEGAKPEYYLDYDYFKEIVKVEELPDLLHHFHKYSFSFFHWSLGPKAITLLGASAKKGIN